MYFKVIFQRNGKKGNKDTCKTQRVQSNRRVDVSETQIYWSFLRVARKVYMMYRV
jgi:hypothetical protein